MIKYALFETRSFYWLIGFNNVIRLYYDLDDEMWVMVNYQAHGVYFNASNEPKLAENVSYGYPVNNS